MIQKDDKITEEGGKGDEKCFDGKRRRNREVFFLLLLMYCQPSLNSSVVFFFFFCLQWFPLFPIRSKYNETR